MFFDRGKVSPAGSLGVDLRRDGIDSRARGLDNPCKICYNRDSRALEKMHGKDSTEGGATMKRTAQNRFKALTSACVLSMMATVAWSQQPSITWLGVLPRGRETVAHGVSQDGNVVVGIAVDENSRQRAFRWTRTGGIQDLGTLGGTEAVALGVSANGAVVHHHLSYLGYRRRNFSRASHTPKRQSTPQPDASRAHAHASTARRTQPMSDKR